MRPIEEVLRDHRTSPGVAVLLREVAPIKVFAEEMGLKSTKNYRDYVQLDREAVVYVVVASERLKFEPKRWWFPIVGSITYLGWFDRGAADRHASQLKDEGWDVYVRGTSAYSTLGWFNDPILSTMLESGDTAMGSLVNTILHESVHAKLYIDGQSYLNESLASFVADQITPVYLKRRFGNESPHTTAWTTKEKRRLEWAQEMQTAYERLVKVYGSPVSQDEKIQMKSDVFSEIKNKWNIQTDLNNAALIQFRTYGLGGREFHELFERCEKNWARFWRAIETLRPESFEQEHSEKFGNTLALLSCKD